MAVFGNTGFWVDGFGCFLDLLAIILLPFLYV